MKSEEYQKLLIDLNSATTGNQEIDAKITVNNIRETSRIILAAKIRNHGSGHELPTIIRSEYIQESIAIAVDHELALDKMEREAMAIIKNETK